MALTRTGRGRTKMGKQMSVKKARRVLKNIRKDNYNYLITGAMDVAIQALEKQKPKKPKLTDLGWDYGDSYKDTLNTRPDCPKCGHLLRLKDGVKFNYCPSCGQKIDWREN